MKKSLCLLAISAFLFASCEDMFTEDGELSSTDIVEGLKTALNVGTDSSTATLSLKNGYFLDETVKIPLPDEVSDLMENLEFIRKYSSTTANLLDEKLGDLVEAINHSAEDAAAEAKPIFTDAITSLSITDGLAILNGEVPESTLKSVENFDSLAATKYLKQQTYNDLVAAYSPKMSAALDKDLIGSASASSLWNDITQNYNGFVSQYGTVARLAAKAVGKDIAFNEVDTDLGEFVTEKALDGLFLKVGEQEKAIRKNPFQWASDILKKVFGSVCNAVKTDEE